MPQEEQPQPKQREIEYRTQPEGLVRIYSNNVSMASTRLDVRLLFGEVIDLADEKVIIENRVQVTLTWQEAKVLADFVQANIKAFEELNGPITLPAIPEKIAVPQTFTNVK
jgi:hypothetical protein